MRNSFLLLRRSGKCYEGKCYHYQIYHCFNDRPSFHEKLFQKEKKYIVRDLYLATLRPFVVQWTVKIAGLPPQLKSLLFNTSAEVFYSSAKSFTVDSMFSNKSLMYIRERSGRRIDPCGTPAFTGNHSEV